MADGRAHGTDGGAAAGARRGRRGEPGFPVTGSKRAAATARSVLRGELENVGLPTILSMLEMERRSGVLVLERPRQGPARVQLGQLGDVGKLHVWEGRVVRARLDGERGSLAGPEAVFEMLSWSEGIFELWRTPFEAPLSQRHEDQVGESTTFLLIEAARRSDEAADALRPSDSRFDDGAAEL
jgi:hypothetical protein